MPDRIENYRDLLQGIRSNQSDIIPANTGEK